MTVSTRQIARADALKYGDVRILAPTPNQSAVDRGLTYSCMDTSRNPPIRMKAKKT